MIENELIEIQAKVMVEELLLRRYSNAQVVRVMSAPPTDKDRNKVVLKSAETLRLIKAIREEWASASEELREVRRDQQRRSLENLYRKAFEEKKYTVCLGIERLLAEIDGTMAPKRVQVSAPKRDEDEFADRSEAELNFYAEHGCFPEEAH